MYKKHHNPDCIFDSIELGYIVDEIDDQPTAYDVDAVIEAMKESAGNILNATKYGNKTSEQQDFSYSTMMMYEIAMEIEDLIEIVRNGGLK